MTSTAPMITIAQIQAGVTGAGAGGKVTVTGGGTVIVVTVVVPGGMVMVVLVVVGTIGWDMVVKAP